MTTVSQYMITLFMTPFELTSYRADRILAQEESLTSSIIIVL